MIQGLLFSEPKEDFLMEHFSADGFYPDHARAALEKRMSDKLEITDIFNRQSVSFQLSRKDVVHRWLRYKEGFSANLVNILLDRFGTKPGEWIMDPFMGSGTTAFVCRMRGINCAGYDILPLSSVAIRAKAEVLSYDLQELQALISAVRALELPDSYRKVTPSITITEDAYPPENARFFSYINDWMQNQAYSEEIKNLLRLCIVNSLERCSYTVKSGQYLGWDGRSSKVINANARRAAEGKRLLPTKEVRPVIQDAKETVLNELVHFYEDICLVQREGLSERSAQISFVQNSALFELPSFPDDALSGVITSPPYCNRYDYTRTYALELVYLGMDDAAIKKLRQTLLSCTVENRSKLSTLKAHYEKLGLLDRFLHISAAIQENEAFHEIISALYARKEHGDLNNNGVIRMVEGYFTELAFVFAELFRTCRKGASVAFVNDNVRYGGEVIPVDFLCSSFAEQFGFRVDTIYTLKQQKGNSSQQMAKFGRVPLRKSITIWTKP